MATRKGRYFRKVNWICRVKSDIYRWIKKKGTINVDYVSCQVRKYDDIIQCFKCQEYGHLMRNCSEKDEYCYRCGEKRSSRTCTSEKKGCINCKRFEVSGGKHEARDWGCEIRRRVIACRQIVVYTGDGY